MELNILESYGIDCEGGITRCMGDSVFYGKILLLFLQDESFENAKDALLRRDYTALFGFLHELKGSCGNAGLIALYEAVSPLVELLRPGNAPEKETALLFSRVEAAYRRAVEGITLALEA